MLLQQTARYADFYEPFRSIRFKFRFDVHYRWRRLREVMRQLEIATEGLDVLDVGFGSGELLARFPRSCRLTGVEVSDSAVRAARQDPRFERFARARFHTIREDVYDDLPAGPFDLIASSHVLEHVADDAAMLAALRQRLRPGGVLVLFVPLEEPDYILYHRRCYSLQSIAERVALGRYELLRVEGSLYVNGHVWKLLTIPSRRQWPVVGALVDALRLTTLSAIPYPVLVRLDAALFRLGFSPRQALIVARRPG